MCVSNDKPRHSWPDICVHRKSLLFEKFESMSRRLHLYIYLVAHITWYKALVREKEIASAAPLIHWLKSDAGCTGSLPLILLSRIRLSRHARFCSTEIMADTLRNRHSIECSFFARCAHLCITRRKKWVQLQHNYALCEIDTRSS